MIKSNASATKWRLAAVTLALCSLTWPGLPSSAAQVKGQKRILTVRVGNATQGSRVRVVSDLALDDYQAFRRGDRFYVKIPASQIAGAQSGFHGNGFEDGQLQSANDSVVLSFKLQPGAVARVEQQSNRLDVVFSTAARWDTASSNVNRPASLNGNKNAQGIEKTWSDGPGNRRAEALAVNRSPGTRSQVVGQATTSAAAGSPSVSSSRPDRNKTSRTRSSTQAPDETSGATGVSALTPGSRDGSVNSSQQLVSDLSGATVSSSAADAPSQKRLLQHWIPGLIAFLLLFTFLLLRAIRNRRNNNLQIGEVASDAEAEAYLATQPVEPAPSILHISEVAKQPADRPEEELPFRKADLNEDIVPPVSGLDLSPELLRRLESESSTERVNALDDVVRLGDAHAFTWLTRAFDDASPDVRNAAARYLFDLRADRSLFAQAFREGSPERRRRIGAAIAGSGLANNAIHNLTGVNREQTYEAFSLLFLMAKTGELQPLIQAIEDFPEIEARLSVIRVLELSEQPGIIPLFRRLASSGSLPSEVQAALIEAINQVRSEERTIARSAV